MSGIMNIWSLMMKDVLEITKSKMKLTQYVPPLGMILTRSRFTDTPSIKVIILQTLPPALNHNALFVVGLSFGALSPLERRCSVTL